MILVEISSDMACLENNASWNCQTNTVGDRRCDYRWLRREDMLGNFHFSY